MPFMPMAEMAFIVNRLAMLMASPAVLPAAAATCSAHSADSATHGAVLLQTQGKLQKVGDEIQSTGAVELAQHAEETCDFMVPPMTPYFWDPTCASGGLGCLADGLHPECRFCGDAPETFIECPRFAVRPKYGYCRFEPEQRMPVTDFYWDSECKQGMLGCKADGRHTECRFCGGEGDYKDIPCPQCMFPAPPSTPYYWDNDCRLGGLGCNADGIHPECRFCAHTPFESVPCPESVMPSNGTCFFPNEPKVGYYWDVHCAMGLKGCNADGLHVHCRFCGSGVYDDIACP